MIKLENKHIPWVFLIILLLIVGLVTYWRIIMHLYLWPPYDTYDLLANAALFAGKGIGYSDLLRPPLLPFLTSIYFMFNGLSIAPILIVDGLLCIFGYVGFYLFLKERFSPSISFIGSLLYVTSPLILIYAGAGYNDIPSVSLGIWALYLTYLGVQKNPKFFYLTFPMAMLAFNQIQYGIANISNVIFYLDQLEGDQTTKKFGGGYYFRMFCLISSIDFFNMKLGNPLYPFMSFFGTSGGSSASSLHFAYNPDLLYYLKHIPVYLGATALLIVFSTLFALLVYIYKKMDKIRHFKWEQIKKDGCKTNLILILALFIIFTCTFGKLHYLWSEIILLAILYLINNVSSKLGWDWKMDILFLSWFATFLIFHSVYVTKDHRYFIFMIAPATYFLVRGFKFTVEMLRFHYKNQNLTLHAFSSILIVLMIVFTFAQFDSIEKANMGNKVFNEDARDASNWLKNYDPDYKSKLIYADFGQCSYGTCR